MELSNILFIVLLCLGALQGIIYGVVLCYNKGPNKIANRFLAAILFFFSYRLIVETLRLFGLGDYDIWYHFMLEYNWVYGALIFFFGKAYMTPGFKLNAKHWIHFLPVTIEFVWSIFIKSQNFYWDGTRESLSWLGYWGFVVWMHYPTMYVIAGILIIFYTIRVERLFNNEGTDDITYIKQNLKWIKRVIISLRIYSILMLLLVIFDFLVFNYALDNLNYYLLFSGLALITYWLGMEGFSKRNQQVMVLKPVISTQEKEQLDLIATQMVALMKTDKLYKDQNLSLDSLAERLGIKSYLLTKCLKIHFGKKFNDYINQLRIEELKKLLQNPGNNHLTLLSLAFDAGFNSKASFNRAVKKLTGKSPSELKEQH